MKTKIVAAVLTAAMLFQSSGAEAIERKKLDANGDGVVNVYDLTWMKRSRERSLSDCRDLAEYLVGKPVTITDTPETPVEIDESMILEPKGTIHTGDGTFYGGGYEGGCAMLDPIRPEDCWVVAMNLADYNNAQLAGACIEVTGELGSIRMLVTDLLPEGKKGDLDLCEAAFPLIAPVEKGRVPVQWKIVPLDSAADAPVSYRFKEGSTAYWCGIQVRNHRYPITRLEYLDKNGEFVALPRKQYNYFESDAMGSGPFTFRITDIYGQMIIDKNIPFVADGIVSGNSQFPE